MEIIHRNLKLEVKVGCWEENARTNDIVFVTSALFETPNMRNLCDAFNQFL